ncbi:MAG: type III pantothenate kinase [Kiritimatiellia bacterium]|jgi:type III pantothenate kinase
MARRIVHRPRYVVIDAGNTSTVTGCFSSGKVSCAECIAGGVAADAAACEAALLRAAGLQGAEAAILASVVPAHVAPWERLVRKTLGLDLAVLDHTFDLPVTLDYPAPETTGADRLANVCGAVSRVPQGTPVMVVDIGTAVTYDLVSADRRFFTGVIGPGPRMIAQALHEKTALLPLVEPTGRYPRMARDTAGAMRVGIEVGFRGMLRETIATLLPLLGPGARFFATGGLARRYIPPLGMGFRIDPHLTLFGLGAILARRLGKEIPA